MADAFSNSGMVIETYLYSKVDFRVFISTNGVYATIDPALSVSGSSLMSLNE